jgi:hypothetical protein
LDEVLRFIRILSTKYVSGANIIDTKSTQFPLSHHFFYNASQTHSLIGSKKESMDEINADLRDRMRLTDGGRGRQGQIADGAAAAGGERRGRGQGWEGASFTVVFFHCLLPHALFIYGYIL